MSFSVKAGVLAAASALALAFAGNYLLLSLMGPEVIPKPMLGATLLSSVAAASAFAFVALTVSRRLGRVTPVLGAVRGALLSLPVFAVTVFCHAAVYPGAKGVLGSFVVQFLFAFALVGAAAIIVGGFMGSYIERLARKHGT